MTRASKPATIRSTSIWRGLAFFSAAALAVAALAAASLVACQAQANPSAPSSAGAQPGSDLFAVVTGNDVDALVGIDVARRTVTQVAVIEQNPAEFDAFVGGPISRPPVSVVLSDSTGSAPLVWTENPAANTLAVRAFDPATVELRNVAVDRPGVLPFLADGKLGWASAPRAGGPRLVSADRTFEMDLPAEPRLIVGGPGPGRITAVLDFGNRDERIVSIDAASRSLTELPTVRLNFDGIWADDTTLVASIFSRIEPTPQDPENGEPDNRVLTWTVDDGSDPDAVAGLVEGPTLRTNRFYPSLVTGRDGLVAVITGDFDRPSVEIFDLGSDDPPRKLDLTASEFVTAMAVSGTTLVVLQNRHVTFIDLSSGERTIADLGGVTGTTWVGP